MAPSAAKGTVGIMRLKIIFGVSALIMSTASLAVFISLPKDPTPPSQKWAESVLRDCRNEDLSKCTGIKIAKVSKKDIPMVFKAASALAASAPGAYDCHTALHYTALELVKEFDPEYLLKFYDPACLDGFSHGVLEGFALTAKETVFEEKIWGLCSIFEKDSLKRDTCLHGIGHALMLRYPDSIKAVATSCDFFKGTDAYVCGQGVFMSYTNEGGPSLSGRDVNISLTRLDSKEAESLCKSIPTSVAPACWDAAWLFFDPVSTDVPKIMENLCKTSGDFKDVCYQGLGLSLFFRSGSEPPSDPETFKSFVSSKFSLCPIEYQGSCYTGLSYAGTLWWGSFQDSIESYPSVCGLIDPDSKDLVDACTKGESRINLEKDLAS